MRIFVAGATGTLGRPVVRELVNRQHDVVGLTRTQDGARRIGDMGAHAVVGNALDAGRVSGLIVEARPDVVVHLLTALPPGGVMRKGQLRPTNELRTAGTANLIAGALAAGARRIVAESFLGIYAGANASRPLAEDTSLPPPMEGPFKDTLIALRSLEEQLRTANAGSGIETVALRIGFLYGSDVPSTRLMIDQMRRGRMFVPAGLPGVASFVHNDDAAAEEGSRMGRQDHGAGHRRNGIRKSAAGQLQGQARARLDAAVSDRRTRTVGDSRITGCCMIDVATFQSLRPHLFSVAYRMLGSATDAEDIVQDAWLRAASAPGTLESARAWLTTVVTRLCLDRLKSARKRREEYVGPWLPEPVPTGAVESAKDAAARHESVTLAFLVLLETLSPAERAAFLLREVFDGDYGKVHLSHINGETALVTYDHGTLDSVFVCSTDGERITAIRAIRNPEKLRWLAARHQ